MTLSEEALESRITPVAARSSRASCASPRACLLAS